MKPAALNVKSGKGNPWKDIILPILLIVAASAFAFGGVTKNGFIEFSDDEPYLLDNPQVRQGLTWQSVIWAFTTFHAANWHPLTWLSHMTDASLFGYSATGHHLMSLFIHTLAALLLFAFLLYTTARPWSACVAAILFTVHPLRVESVAWAAERKDVLSAFFWFAAVLAYAVYARKGGLKGYLCVVVFFSIGLMAKPMLVTLPLILLLLDYWPLNRIGIVSISRLLAEKVPLIILSLISSVITLLAQKEAIATLYEVDIVTRLANASVSCGKYITQMFTPVDLSAFYPYSLSFISLRLQGAIVFLVLAAATAAVIYLGRSRRYLITGWFWYLFTLLPVIGIVQVGWQAHADRYTYIPMTGLLIALVWAVRNIVGDKLVAARLAGAAALAAVIILSLLTARQVGYWKDSFTLYTHSLAVTKNNAFVHRNLVYVYIHRGELDKAVEHARSAVSIDPQWYEGHVLLGRALMEQGRFDEAIAAGIRGVELGRGFALSHFHLAQSYAAKGDYESAVKSFTAALALEENHAAWNDMGVCLKLLGRIDEAERAYRRAIELRPDEPSSRQNLAIILLARGQKAEAAVHIRTALSVQPDNPVFRQLLEQASKP